MAATLIEERLRVLLMVRPARLEMVLCALISKIRVAECRVEGIEVGEDGWKVAVSCSMQRDEEKKLRTAMYGFEKDGTVFTAPPVWAQA